MLALGLVAGRRGRKTARGFNHRGTRPARVALGVAAAYALGMAVLGIAARSVARRELEAGGGRVDQLMVAPSPLTPLVRQVVAAEGASYRVATFRWLARPHLDPASERRFPRPRADDPALTAARATPLGARFLRWARFPAVQVQPRPAGGALIHLIDLRYADRPDAGFGAVTVATASPPAELSR